MSDEEVDEAVRTKRWSQHTAIALVFGFNELAKKATTLGEKVYFRAARDAANEVAREEGVMVNIAPVNAVLLLPGVPPRVTFSESDMVLMRAAVNEWFANKAEYGLELDK